MQDLINSETLEQLQGVLGGRNVTHNFASSRRTDTMPMHFQASLSKTDPFAYTPSLVTRNPDNFFGGVGNAVARFAGLTATGIDGTESPIFRTNIFDKPNMGMTGFSYSNLVNSAKLSNAAGAGYSDSLGESVSSIFAPDSLLGKMAYSTDAEGHYVYSKGFRDLAKFAQGAAKNPMVANQIGGAINDWLGYDRGAGANVYAGRAKYMVNSQNQNYFNPNRSAGGTGAGRDSTFSVDEYGRPRFNARAMSEEDQARMERTAAQTMTAATDRVMYNGGLTRDWSVTHGLSDTMMSTLFSEAVANGMVEDHSVMSEEDRKKQAEIDTIQKEVNSSVHEREKLIKQQEELRAAGGDKNRKKAKKLQAQIDYYSNDIAARTAEQDELKSQMKTHDGFGTFNDVLEKNTELEKQKDDVRKRMYGTGRDGDAGKAGEIDSLQKELDEIEQTGAKRSSKGRKKSDIEAALKRAQAELEMMESEVESITSEQEKVAGAMDRTLREIGKSLSGAVDSLKDYVGGEDEAREMLERLTGNRATKEKGAAQMVEDQTRETMMIARRAGVDPMRAGQIMNSMIGAAQSSMLGLDARSAALIGNTSFTGQMGLLGTRYALQAQAGLTNEQDRKLAEAGAQFGIEEGMNSGVGRAVIQLQSALEHNTISQEEYDEYAEAFKNSDPVERQRQLERFWKRAYGSVDEGRKEFNDSDRLAFLTRPENMSAEGGKQMADLFNQARQAEQNNEQQQTVLRRDQKRAAARLKSAGVSQKTMREISSKADYDAIIEALGADENDNSSLYARETMQKEYDATYRKAIESGKTEEEAKRMAQDAATRLYDTSLKSDVGEAEQRVRATRTQRTTEAFNEYGDRTALTADQLKESGGVLGDIISGVSGVLEEDGSVSVANLSEATDTVLERVNKMGRAQREEMGLGTKELGDIKKRLAKARESGDTAEATRIVNEEILSKFSDNDKARTQEDLKKKGIENKKQRTEREERIKNSASEAIATASGTIKTLSGKGDVVAIAHELQVNKELADGTITRSADSEEFDRTLQARELLSSGKITQEQYDEYMNSMHDKESTTEKRTKAQEKLWETAYGSVEEGRANVAKVENSDYINYTKSLLDSGKITQEQYDEYSKAINSKKSTEESRREAQEKIWESAFGSAEAGEKAFVNDTQEKKFASLSKEEQDKVRSEYLQSVTTKEGIHRNEEAKRNRASGEVLLDAITGKEDLSTVFGNSNVTPEERKKRMAELGEKVGVQLLSMVGEGNAPLGGYAGAENEMNGGYPSVSGGYGQQVGVAMGGDNGATIANIANMSDDQFREFYAQMGGNMESTMWGTDVENVLDWKHEFNKADNEEDRNEIMQKMLRHVGDLQKGQSSKIQKAIKSGKLSDDEAEVLRQQQQAIDQNREQLGSAKKSLKTGEVVLDDSEMNRMRGGSGTGGSNDGQLGRTMEKLINEIGILVSVLKTHGGSSTYQ